MVELKKKNDISLQEHKIQTVQTIKFPGMTLDYIWIDLRTGHNFTSSTLGR